MPKNQAIDSDTASTDNSIDVAATALSASTLPDGAKPIPDFISESLKKSLKDNGITSLFEVQHRTIDYSISGLDMIVQARTGSGKTLAFVLPTIERLISSKIKINPNQPRVLIMAPTRELALQTQKVVQMVTSATDLKSACVYGGASYTDQKWALQKGAAVVTGTPGRINDFVENGYMDLSKVKVVILDEVDRMLDMGFAEMVENIMKKAPYDNPKKKPQTLFYSATCPDWVQAKAREYMTEDLQHIVLVNTNNRIAGASKTVEHLSVQIDRWEGIPTCVRDLVRLYSAGRSNGRAIVFTQTKKEANDLALGEVSIGDAQVMHGDIEQKQREVTLKGFREGKFRCLVATDVAARGLDIPEIDLVVQTSPPKGGDIESYVHRSGRTGRAGKNGICVCLYNFKTKYSLKSIERETGVEFRDIPIPQPVDVAKSVMEEKLSADIKAVIEDPDEQWKDFKKLKKQVISMCEDDKDKAISCLLTYIAQGGESLDARSMISGQEGYQTWLLETDNDEVKSPVGLISAILSRNNIDRELYSEIKTWRMYAEAPESFGNGAGVAFDLKHEFTKRILESWKNGEQRMTGKDSVILKKCGSSLPKMRGFMSNKRDRQDFGRGNSRGGRGGRGGNRFQGRDGGDRGQKRNFGRGRSDYGGEKRFKPSR